MSAQENSNIADRPIANINRLRENSAQAPLQPKHTPTDAQALLADVQTYLYRTLQTTLDIERLLNVFFLQVNKLCGVSGLSFRGKQVDIELTIGSRALHSFQYQLSTGENDVGELICYAKNRVNGLNIEVLEIAASTLVYPLYNAQLFKHAQQQALCDPLTRLGNRQLLNNTLRNSVASAIRHQHSLSLLMVDIDHFKHINDAFGHDVGDKVIKQVAHAIRKLARDTDTACRFGGEEFVVLLDNTDASGAATAAERIRCEVANLRLPEIGGRQLSVSIGAATLTLQDDEQSLIKRADMALYRAKSNGRNRICEG